MEGDDPLDEALGCAAFEYPEELELAVVTVRIVNATDEAILISNRTSGCGQPKRHFEVVGSAGGRVMHAPTIYCDYGSCQPWLGGQVICGQCATLHPPLHLEAGEAIEESWEAWMLAEAVVSPECNVGGDEAQACLHEVAMLPGTYSVSTDAVRVSECASECECEGDPGMCGWTVPSVVSPTLFATAAYDGVCDRVELVISE